MLFSLDSHARNMTECMDEMRIQTHFLQSSITKCLILYISLMHVQGAVGEEMKGAD